MSKQVQDYVLQKFFRENFQTEDEVRFQFLFFIYNLIVHKQQQIDIEQLMQYISQLDVKQERSVSLVLNIFDALLGLAHFEGRPVESLRNQKLSFIQSQVIQSVH